MIAISHPTGNANVRNAILALRENDRLGAFLTTISAPPALLQARIVPSRWRRWLRRRSYPEEIWPRTVTFPLREMGRLGFASSRATAWLVRPNRAFSAYAVYRAFDRSVAAWLRRSSSTLEAVYCYEDGALETFRAAKRRGLKTIYELPTPYWRLKQQIAEEESARGTFDAATAEAYREPKHKQVLKDEELALADLVVVPSAFVADSLQRAPGFSGRVVVVPYGAPSNPDVAVPAARDATDLQVIYVGNFGPAKGVNDLPECWRRLTRSAQLTLIGARPANPSPELAVFLTRHRYLGSLPHDEVLTEMHRHDVLILPSLFEGLALVLLEAMSQGLALVTTFNSGIAGVVADGREGFLVPIRAPAALAEKLDLLAGDRVLLQRMRQSAAATAGRMTWSNYRRQLFAAITSHA